MAFDAPPTGAPVNAVASSARAVLNLRVHPEQDAGQAQDVLVAHLEALRPFGIALEVTRGEVGNGIAASTGGPGFDAAMAALSTAWGERADLMAGGGSIPIVMSLHEAVPDAEVLMFGAIDGFANIHGPNERLLVDEFRKAAVATAVFFREYAARYTARYAAAG